MVVIAVIVVTIVVPVIVIPIVIIPIVIEHKALHELKGQAILCGNGFNLLLGDSAARSVLLAANVHAADKGVIIGEEELQ